MTDDDTTTTDDKQEKRFIDPKTGATSVSAGASGVTGSGSEAGRQGEHQITGGGKPTTDTVDTGHSDPGSTLGGRGPAAGQGTIGDQDSTQARTDMDTVDPMTSRAPNDLDKINEHQASKGIAERDP